jgi:hypothetical protein
LSCFSYVWPLGIWHYELVNFLQIANYRASTKLPRFHQITAFPANHRASSKLLRFHQITAFPPNFRVSRWAARFHVVKARRTGLPRFQMRRAPFISQNAMLILLF